MSDFKAISNDLTEKGREKEAAQLLTDVLKIYPDRCRDAPTALRHAHFLRRYSGRAGTGDDPPSSFALLRPAVERQRGAADFPEQPD